MTARLLIKRISAMVHFKNLGKLFTPPPLPDSILDDTDLFCDGPYCKRAGHPEHIA